MVHLLRFILLLISFVFGASGCLILGGFVLTFTNVGRVLVYFLISIPSLMWSGYRSKFLSFAEFK